jgi:uncharacterized membrane protein
MNGMGEHEPRWVDDAISSLLRIGVLLAIVTVLTGLLLTFFHHPHYVSSRTDLGRLTDPDAQYPHGLGDVFRGVRELHGQAVVMLGLLLLIATPVARVAFSIAAFAVARDGLYVWITTLVLLLLLLSFVLGAGG